MGFRKAGSNNWKNSTAKSSPASGVRVQRVNTGPTQLLKGSKQQEAIWEKLVNSDRHMVIEALAGTGKTTTTLQGFYRLGQEAAGRTGFLAFNKSIAKELQAKCPEWVSASTFHSLLLGKCITPAYGRVQIDGRKTDIILENLVGENEYQRMEMSFRNRISKMVGLVKNTLSGTGEVDLDILADKYSIDLNGDREKMFELVPEIVELSQHDQSIIDWDDILWLPVVNNLSLPKFDLLAVDEYQDTNPCQQASLMKMSKRLLLVGDKNQSIYGFRGAGVSSMQDAIKALEASERGVDVMPLTQTRRCPKSHVQIAQQIVPTFEALEEAPEGVIDNMLEEEAVPQMGPGDLVLCRLNAPVVGTAFRLLKQGIKANIQGRDIGQGLKWLIKRLRPGSGPGSVGTLILKTESYFSKELQKLRAMKRPPESRIVSLEDKKDCLMSFCDGADDVNDVYSRIDEMFTDQEAGEGGYRNFVLLSTVHRAKGLEANTVWILYPELMPHKMAEADWEIQQEHNIRYVALTRSKNRLVLVSRKS